MRDSTRKGCPNTLSKRAGMDYGEVLRRAAEAANVTGDDCRAVALIDRALRELGDQSGVGQPGSLSTLARQLMLVAAMAYSSRRRPSGTVYQRSLTTRP